MFRRRRRVRPRSRPASRRTTRPGAEAWTAHLDRAQSVLRTIIDKHADGAVLIVGPGETVTAAAHLLLNLDAAIRATLGLTVHYASITSWEQQPVAATFPDDRWRRSLA